MRRPAATALSTVVAALLASAAFAGEAGALTYYHVDAPAAEKRLFTLSGVVRAGSPKRVAADFSSKGIEAFTVYSARSASRASRRRIRARVPRLGHVAVRFHERRTRRDVAHLFGTCKVVTVSRVGRFTGVIDVHGDGGYPGVDRRSASGGYERLNIRGCGGGGRRAADSRPARTGILTSCVPGSPTGFVAVGGASRSSFAASSRETLGRLSIYRYATTDGGARGAFRIGSGYDTARVEPPGRWFDGSARFEDGRLTGDLTANFIGASGSPLTPGAARLTDGRRPVASRKCAAHLPILREAVPAAERLGLPPYLSRAVISK